MPRSNLMRLASLTQELLLRDEVIKKNEHVLSMFFDLSLDLLCIADLKTGRFVRANRAWIDLGWTPEEMTAIPFMEFVHPDDVHSTQGIAQDLESGHRVFQFRNRYRCKDGSYKLLSWSAIQDNDTMLTYCAARIVQEDSDGQR